VRPGARAVPGVFGSLDRDIPQATNAKTRLTRASKTAISWPLLNDLEQRRPGRDELLPICSILIRYNKKILYITMKSPISMSIWHPWCSVIMPTVS
jgi:hypothetical protein